MDDISSTNRPPQAAHSADDRGFWLPVSPHGLREMAIITLGAVLVSVGVGYLWPPAAAIVAVIWLALILFFRDPTRRVPDDPMAYVAPADGKVTEITPIEHDDRIGGPATRIGIFLSVFNVHINRAPCPAVIEKIQYKKGKFHNAMGTASSEENEANTLVMDGGPVFGRFVVKQIAGLIARRIVCAVAPGDRVERGQRFGMIKFGSRTELVIGRPEGLEVTVRIGDNVRAGCTIMARRRGNP